MYTYKKSRSLHSCPTKNLHDTCLVIKKISLHNCKELFNLFHFYYLRKVSSSIWSKYLTSSTDHGKVHPVLFHHNF